MQVVVEVEHMLSDMVQPMMGVLLVMVVQVVAVLQVLPAHGILVL